METGYLTAGPLTQDLISQLIEKAGTRTTSGGHSVFLGQVRADVENSKTVTAIDYSAYEGMVTTEADKIKDMIFAEFNDVTSVDIVHSTGLVRAGEISLLVLVSAGHRKQAMEACARTVDLVKEKLPVWKQEIFDDDSHEWR